MSTTLTRRPRTRRHRLTGPQEDYCFRLSAADLDAMNEAARKRDCSIAEAMRQAVRLFLAMDMNMIHVHDIRRDADHD